MNLEGKIVTVVGLARSGQAAARLAFQVGAIVRVTDCGSSDQVDSLFIEWLSANNISSEFCGHHEEMVEGSDVVVISPGVRNDAEPVQWAQKKDISVIGELEFAYQFCPCPIIAVTGSNGKTTVTTLIGRVLEKAGKSVFVGGNIGRPLSQHVLDLTAEHIAVLEVSSFQLETIKQFRPQIAVFLNISQNHLDRHADMDEYFRMKAKVFENQAVDDVAILNVRDEKVESLVGELSSRVVWFNGDEQRQKTGYDNPNFLAVDAVMSVLNVERSLMEDVFAEFQGLEHRMEVVREINGVSFINDSKSTTTEASRWALEQIKAPIIWICGGRDKNLDFSVLCEVVDIKVKKIIAIGESAEKIKQTFSNVKEVECVDGFEAAVAKAFGKTQSGDVVLLSPMCASFDMFANFECRGEEFKKIVNEL